MNNDELSDLYKIRFTEQELPRKNAIWQVLCRDYLQRFIPTTDTVVDLACGYGEFTNNIVAGRKIAIDLNADARSFLGPEVEFHLCKATELSSVVSEVDTVFTSNFLEHLPDKKVLDELLDQVLLALKPGGQLIILGPNLGGCRS